MQNDGSVVIKLPDARFTVVAWDRNDYLKEAEKQLSDKKNTQKLELQKKIKLSWLKKVTICFQT